jgi:malonyl CoA-acyl carrier protein transacylase/thioesterase domain-containing protein
VEEAPAAEPTPSPTRPRPPAVPVLLSARTRAALRGQAERLHAHVRDNPELDLLDVGFSTATTRAGLARRAAVAARDRDELLDGLAALAADEAAEHAVDGKVMDGKTVFVFPGHGSQWAEMAVTLLDTAPAFAAEIAACAKAFGPYVDWNLEDVLRGAPGAPSMDGVVPVHVLQPAVFSVMVSLAALWRAHGVEPDAVVGHSQGEVAAAYVAGALSLEDAARIVVLRNRIAHDRLPNDAGLLWIGAPDDEVDRRIRKHAGRVAVAVVNSPVSVVVAGDADVLAEVKAEYEADGVRTRALGLGFASHTAAVEVLEAELVEALAPVAPRPARVPFYSSALDEYVDGAELDARYWYGNLRNRVGFETAVAALIEDGVTRFVEISPHPMLLTAIEQTAVAYDVEGRGETVATVGTLKRDEGGLDRFALSLAEAHTVGIDIDWAGFYAGTGAGPAPLPTYAFQHKRYWLAPGQLGAAPASSAAEPEDDGGEGGALVRQLAAVPADEREPLVQGVVRKHVAAVLGYASGDAIEADQGFWELGFNSVGVVRLCTRLGRVTGISVPSTAVFEHPDVPGLSRWLVQQVAGEVAVADPAGAESTPDGAGPDDTIAPESGAMFTALMRHAFNTGELDRGLDWLMDASRFRPAFTSPEQLPAGGGHVVRLARGDSDTAVVCVPSFAVGSGPHLFLGLAQGLPGRDVYSCALPGFRDGEALPGAWAAAMEVLAAEIRQAVGDAEIVLVGYSIGGAVAHALALELERTGRAVAGLVLLDSPSPQFVIDNGGGVFRSSMTRMLAGDFDAVLDAVGWLAMGAYLRLLPERADTAVEVPMLYVRAGEEHSWQRWDVGGDVVDVTTDHFDMINDPACATAVDTWIRRGSSADSTDSGSPDKETP